ncbi:MAG: hypothetical protein RL258_177 [Pseudomonadota bacterium]
MGGSLTDSPLLTEHEVSDLIASAVDCLIPTVATEAHGHRAGDWPGTRLGQGLDFEESRPYTASDAIRDMDWRSTARLGHAYVKTYREERQPIWAIVVDRGPLMRFGSRRRLKVTQAARAAVWIGAQALAQGAAVTLNLWDRSDTWLGPFHEQDQWIAALQALIAPAPPIWASSGSAEEDTNTDRLELLTERLPAGTRVFLITDFHWLHSPDTIALARLAQASQPTAIRISDPLEREIRPEGLVRLRAPGERYSFFVTHNSEVWHDKVNRGVAEQRQAQAALFQTLRMTCRDLCVTDEDLVRHLS